MALNLKNKEVEALAAEVALLAKESKTEAVRRALLERKARLTSVTPVLKRSTRAASILEEFRKALPPELLGKRLSREEEDEILGYGPDGVRDGA
jgi:antitoxin VapB